MTDFLKRLDELREKATPGPWEFRNEPGNEFIVAREKFIAALSGVYSRRNDFQLIVFLVNHAAEIAELVRAAENIHGRYYAGNDGRIISAEHLIALLKALAALDKEKS